MRDYHFGNFLHELRERRGLSQYQLGMLVGVSNKAVSKWENGSAKPRSHTLYRLSEVLEVTVDELLGCGNGSGENKEKKGVASMKKRIWDKVYKTLKYRYGEALPIELSNRYFSEYEEMKDTDEILYYELLGQIGRLAENTGGHMRINGSLGSALAAYVLGASGVNPLKAHYYCPDCHKIRFEEGVLCGWDLPVKKCSCGRELQRDGHNCPFEVLRPGLHKATHYDVYLSQNVYGVAQEMIFSFFQDDTVVALDKQDNPDIRTFVILDTQAVRMEPKVAEGIGRDLLDSKAAEGVGRGLLESRAAEEIEMEQKVAGSIAREVLVLKATGGIPRESQLFFEEFYDRFKQYPMITLIRSEKLDKYRQLELMTKIPFSQVPFTDRKVLEAFCGRFPLASDGQKVENPMQGIPEFESEFVQNMLKETAPGSFHDIIQISGLAHGTGGWLGNGEELIRKGMPIGRLIAWRDDVFWYIQEKIERKNGTGTGYASQIMEKVRLGIYTRDGIPAEIRQQLTELGAEEWFLESIGKIMYLFPRSHGVMHMKYSLIMMWYKIYYPEAFRQCGFCQE